MTHVWGDRIPVLPFCRERGLHPRLRTSCSGALIGDQGICEMTNKAPVFVVGCPRSGTTWFYHILLSSGRFAIYRSEAKIFTYLAPLFGHFRRHTHRERFLNSWLTSESFLRSGLDASELRRRILSDCSSPGDCQRILMDSIMLEQGATRWADCTPDNLLLMKVIKEAFPNALFIHVIRDGRDVALSLGQQGWIRRVPGDRSPSLMPAALYWDWALDRGRATGNTLGGSYMEIHFEDLVRDPVPVLEQVSAFIGHQLLWQRIQETAIGSVSRPNTSFAVADSEEFQPIERWRSVLSTEDCARLESFLGPRLEEMGYQLSISPASPQSVGDKVRAFTYRLSFSSRLWLKMRTTLGRYLSDASLRLIDVSTDERDRTLRPARHREFIRRCVTG